MATLRSEKQSGRDATEAHVAARGRGAGQERSGARGEPRRGEASGESTREWLVARARQRIESGFYEDSLILDAVIHRIARSELQSGGNGSNSSGV
jgi:hypothetical protein